MSKQVSDTDPLFEHYYKQRKRRALLAASIGIAASYVIDAVGIIAIGPHKWAVILIPVKAMIISALLIWRARIK